MAHPRVLTDIDKATIAERYANGETLVAIAADYGIGHNRCREITDAHGVYARPRRQAPMEVAPAPFKLPDVPDTRDMTARLCGDPSVAHRLLWQSGVGR
jgi:hypothetical protein